MIERCYFMKVEKKDQSSGEVHYSSLTSHKVSLFPKPKSMYKLMFEFLKLRLKEHPGTVTVIAFNTVK